MNSETSEKIIDLGPKMTNILKEVLAGLSKSQKMIHPKFLYDEKGSELFEKITQLKEYYPSGTESMILKTYAQEIANLIGPGTLVIEPGSGKSEKIKFLIPALQNLRGYVPIEISKQTLIKTVEELYELFPAIDVKPIHADFTQELNFTLPSENESRKVVIFFPGSTIGNFHPDDAVVFLKKYGKLLSSGGGLLIGVDLKKNRDKFQLAYDDPYGVTAAFNLNLLERLNREAEASFNPEFFEHVAFYDEALGRVEMHLRSRISQLVKVNQTVFRFGEGETIHTESSYKYTPEEFCRLAEKAKFSLKKLWTDPEKLFCVYYFEKL